MKGNTCMTGKACMKGNECKTGKACMKGNECKTGKHTPAFSARKCNLVINSSTLHNNSRTVQDRESVQIPECAARCAEACLYFVKGYLELSSATNRKSVTLEP